MNRPVRLSPAANLDLERLALFMIEKTPVSALRAVSAIERAAMSLETLSDRGRPRTDGLRELDVRFGRYGYIIVYRSDPEAVVIFRIFHSHEDRHS